VVNAKKEQFKFNPIKLTKAITTLQNRRTALLDEGDADGAHQVDLELIELEERLYVSASH
jgi:homogentisate 1,2-dioxygenase